MSGSPAPDEGLELPTTKPAKPPAAASGGFSSTRSRSKLRWQMAVDKVTHEKLQASQEREENSVIKRTSGVDLFLKDAVDVIMLVASLCALALIIESENLSLAWMGMCPLALTAQILILVAASGCKAPPMPACKSEMALHDLTDEHLFKFRYRLGAFLFTGRSITVYVNEVLLAFMAVLASAAYYYSTLIVEAHPTNISSDSASQFIHGEGLLWVWRSPGSAAAPGYTVLSVFLSSHYLVSWHLGFFTAGGLRKKMRFIMEPENVGDMLSLPLSAVLISFLVPTESRFTEPLYSHHTLSVFCLVRLLRVPKTLKRFQAYVRFSDTVIQATFILLVMLLLMWCTAGIMFSLEGPDPECGFRTFFEFFYFSVVTISTVGYGDWSPSSALGRVIVIFVILIALSVVPNQLNVLMELMQHQKFYGATLPHKSNHVVVMGNITATSVNDFLREFCGRSSTKNLQVIFLDSQKPPDALLPMLSTGEVSLSTDQTKATKVSFVVGSPLCWPDLTLINAQSALGFLLIDENLAALGIDCGDLHSAMVHDKAAIVDVLSLHSHCPSVPIHLQIGFSDSVRLLPSHLKRSLGSYIPVLKLKQALLANACVTNGFNTLMGNLVANKDTASATWLHQAARMQGVDDRDSSIGADSRGHPRRRKSTGTSLMSSPERASSFLTGGEMDDREIAKLPDWTFAYARGALCSIYKIRLSEKLENVELSDLADELQEAGITLLGREKAPSSRISQLDDQGKNNSDASSSTGVFRQTTLELPKAPGNRQALINSTSDLSQDHTDCDTILVLAPSNDIALSIANLDSLSTAAGTLSERTADAPRSSQALLSADTFEHFLVHLRPGVNCPMGRPLDDKNHPDSAIIYSAAEKGIEGDHIVFSGPYTDLYHFMQPLRSVVSESSSWPTVVVVNEHPPPYSVWEEVSHFPDLWIVVGNVCEKIVLDSLEIHTARSIVVANHDGKNSILDVASIRGQDRPDLNAIMETMTISQHIRNKRSISAATPGESIAGRSARTRANAVATRSEEWCKQHVITELLSPEQSFALLDGRYSMEGNGMRSFNASAIYASGRIACPSISDSLLCEAFGNPRGFQTVMDCCLSADLYVFSVPISVFMMPPFSEHNHAESQTKQNTSYMRRRSEDIASSLSSSGGLLDSFEDDTYGELCRYVRKNYGLVAMGLYRRASSTSAFSYCVTSPEGETLVDPSDYVFLLQHLKPRRKAIKHIADIMAAQKENAAKKKQAGEVAKSLQSTSTSSLDTGSLPANTGRRTGRVGNTMLADAAAAASIAFAGDGSGGSGGDSLEHGNNAGSGESSTSGIGMMARRGAAAPLQSLQEPDRGEHSDDSDGPLTHKRHSIARHGGRNSVVGGQRMGGSRDEDGVVRVLEDATRAMNGMNTNMMRFSGAMDKLSENIAKLSETLASNSSAGQSHSAEPSAAAEEPESSDV